MSSSDNIITEAVIEASNLSKNVSSIITSYLTFDLQEFMKIQYGYEEFKCELKCDIDTHLCRTCGKHAEYGDLKYVNQSYCTFCLKCRPRIRCKNPKENMKKEKDKLYNTYGEYAADFDENIIKYINEFCHKYICDFCNTEACIHNLYMSETCSTICMDCKNNMVLGLKMVKAFQKKPKTLKE